MPILFLTAHLVDDEDVLRGYGAGAVDYLTKPVNAGDPALEGRGVRRAVPQDARAGAS